MIAHSSSFLPTRKAAALTAGSGLPVIALMLGGGGARGAYQAGVLHGLAERFPELRFPVITGISAGAVNAVHMASTEGTAREVAEKLQELWLGLSAEQVYDVRALPLLANVARWGARLMSGGMTSGSEPMRGMVDTQALRRFLCGHLDRADDGTFPGIASNIASGALRSVALSATSYATGKSTTWIEGKDVELWQRPQRESESVRLSVEHVMASSALPMLFPAIRVGDEWFGDGGIRLTSPLSPALHLGATQILTISTRHHPLQNVGGTTVSRRYPPPAQVLGVLYSSIFLDMIDEDILRLRKMNRLLAGLPPDRREGLRVVEIMVIRPSRDLRTLARDVEPRLPWLIRYMTRGLGTRQAASPDLLSLLLFQPHYIRRLIELGQTDAEAHYHDMEAFLERSETRAGVA